MRKNKVKNPGWAVPIALWVCLVLGSSTFLWASLGGFEPFTSISFTRPAPGVKEKMVIYRDGLILRNQASFDAERLGKVPYAAKVEVLDNPDPVSVRIDGIAGTFVKVRWEDKQGFLFSGYLVPVFFDAENPPDSLSTALSPWTVDARAEISWLSASDIWALESQVWGYSRRDDSTDIPDRKMVLNKKATFLPSDSGQEGSFVLSKDGARSTQVKAVDQGIEISFPASVDEPGSPQKQGQVASKVSEQKPEQKSEQKKETKATSKWSIVVDAKVYKDSFETSKALGSLSKGTLIKVLDKKQNPPDAGIIKETVTVENRGKSYRLEKGRKVAIPAFSAQKCTIAIEVNSEEVLLEVDTTALWVNENAWLQVEAQDGTRGWVKSENAAFAQ